MKECSETRRSRSVGQAKKSTAMGCVVEHCVRLGRSQAGTLESCSGVLLR